MSGPVAVRYDARNPANSIVVAEHWSGLRGKTGSQLASLAVAGGVAGDYAVSHRGSYTSARVSRWNAASIHSEGRLCTLFRMRSCHQAEISRRSSRS